ncbi:hypothetical protein V1264_013320 [Littorina saxatilis]|uniref:Uncharacterized protein n=1 Tax=Littorina saxatilis TaxID=31220 RepID=A0AAN9BQC1_9CAEN
MVYLEALKDGKATAGWNRLEHSVWQGYLDETVLAELCAFALMFFFVCQPLLSRAKVAKSPLEMNFFYLTAVQKLSFYAEHSEALLSEDTNMWQGSIKETEPYRPYMQDVQQMAKDRQGQVTRILSSMATAGRDKLQSHASEHLLGGLYSLPSTSAISAGNLLGSATNDTVESGFGQLDRQQTMNPSRNPLNTSAIAAKRDKPVHFVCQQDQETMALMVSTAIKSGLRARKEAGTRVQQLQKVWAGDLADRNLRKQKRQAYRQKRKQTADDIAKQIFSGGLVRDADTIQRLKSADPAAPYVEPPPTARRSSSRC